MSCNISSEGFNKPLLKELLQILTNYFESIDSEFYVIGATARDIITSSIHKHTSARKTYDLDIAIAIPDWNRFEQISTDLIALGDFKKSTKEKQEFWYKNVFKLDVVPFGEVAGKDKNIYWPPEEDIAMLNEEYGFEMSDMERDFSFTYTDSDGKTKRRKIDLAVSDAGKPHDADGLIRICIVNNDKTKSKDSKKVVEATLQAILEASDNCEFGLWTNGYEGIKKTALWELLNLIFCKIHDEKCRFMPSPNGESYRRKFWVGVKEQNYEEGLKNYQNVSKVFNTPSSY